ncbi:transposase [Endozoicomonas sp. SM1973]|uniref:Transposase n=1 Tax=Spartinivicinus marinus TaxID=2994442 RepID=A0A853II60_9GAMM|nr:transposase [Spartinivicinus marinus]MCX4028829.1 transposase [Spartinivicinus marinus]NYZ69751.1 transposase [Spartinivicinus marinus]
MKKPNYSTEFKVDSANLVINQGYSAKDAAEAVGVSESAMRKWVNKLQQEKQGITPKGKALTAEQQHIQALEAKIKRLEREKDILKKATALLMSDSIKPSV